MVKRLRAFHPTDEAFSLSIRGFMAEELLRPNSHAGKLKALIPPYAPPKVKECFDFMRSHITLEGNGMGVSIRENRSGLMKLMEASGFDYELLKPIIDTFEDNLIKTHYESKDENK